MMTACNSSGSPTAASTHSALSPSAYVSGVCSAVLSWVQGVKSRSTALPAQIATISNLDDGKRIITDFLNGTVGETDVLISKVAGLGAPKVANGADVQSTVTKALQSIRATFVEAETRAKDLPTNDPNAFRAGAEQIGQSFQSELSGLDSKLGVADNPELSQAAQKDPSCQQLSSL
jgi:hypothetical protein